MRSRCAHPSLTARLKFYHSQRVQRSLTVRSAIAHHTFSDRSPYIQHSLIIHCRLELGNEMTNLSDDDKEIIRKGGTGILNACVLVLKIIPTENTSI